MTDSRANRLEPAAGTTSKGVDSNTTAYKKGFQPLLSDPPQIKRVSIGESNAPGTLSKKRLDRCTDGHVKEHTFGPLLPNRSTDDSPKRGTPSHSPETDFNSPGSSSGRTLNTQRPSHEHKEHIAEAATQEKTPRPNRSKLVRHYEWPLIINGVYQGKGPLPSCRIEDDESPTEPRPYAWPLIILHRARSVEDCDQQPDLNGKKPNKSTVDGDKKVDGAKTDDKGIDELRATDGVSAEP